MARRLQIPFCLINAWRLEGSGCLRQYRIDELPQIINILRGEMSWIGPRPEAVSLAEWYEREVPFYVYRHVVRPGISGWAQVHQGNVGAVDAAQLKLEYDFFYIKNFSFWLDIVIVLKRSLARTSAVAARSGRPLDRFRSSDKIRRSCGPRWWA